MAISLSCMQDACTAPIPQNSVGPELPKQYGWALPYSKIMPWVNLPTEFKTN